jgi:hypothetical protein
VDRLLYFVVQHAVQATHRSVRLLSDPLRDPLSLPLASIVLSDARSLSDDDVKAVSLVAN